MTTGPSLILANSAVTLNGQFGELSEARTKRIAENARAWFPEQLPVPLPGFAVLGNPLKRSTLALGPTSLTYHSATPSVDLSELRSLYEQLFTEGLLPEHLAPSLAATLVGPYERPLEHLSAPLTTLFPISITGASLIGVSIRRLFKIDSGLADVSVENNFQGLDQLHYNVKFVSDANVPWADAFGVLDQFVKRLSDISEQLDAKRELA